MSLIPPRTLKGFRDLTPTQARRRADLVRTLEDVFRRHGYAPIETPALEYAEILKGKGGEDTDKELFEFTDKGGRQVALRFDLTVPLARYVAQHQGALVFPFRRYAMGPVWRGERPQRGRYREFWQCDADIIGPVTAAADAEILVLLLDAYASLDVGAVTVRVNDRRILEGILERVGAAGQTVPVLRALDKRDKQGDDVVRKALTEAGIGATGIDALMEATEPTGGDAAVRARLREAVGSSEIGRTGLEHLDAVCGLVDAAGMQGAALQVDPGIARGLDYYTGVVFEVRLESAPGMGSVGSGGRYDDLAGLYTKATLPGVGCSVGIDRLLAALEDQDTTAGVGGTDVLVLHPGDGRLAEAFALAADLRRAGLASEVHPEARKHGQQMRYADRRGVAVAVTLDADGTLHAKRLADGETRSCPDADAVAAWAKGV